MPDTKIIEFLCQKFEEFEWQALKGSKIVDFYKNKTIFVTGATGFFGKLLVEKLLRACPELDTIFILVRPKKGEDSNERIKKLYSLQVFHRLHEMFPNFKDKIKILNGDTSLPDLGLSELDKNIIIDQVDVIFHMAATVRFDEKLTTALAVNLRGTRDLVNIAKKCKNLKSFVYVSTAYAHCVQKEIDEVFYSTPYSSEELIAMLETDAEDELVEKTSKIVKKWPNTYTFSKAISEEVVYKHSGSIPSCIVRPSIVIPTYKEPMKSWIDNIYGITGVIVGAGTGFIKTLYCNPNAVAEIVPGDYVINSLIAASYKTAIGKSNKVEFYNYVSSVEKSHSWSEMMEYVQKYGVYIPTVHCVWYYSLTTNPNYIIHMIYTVILHFLPGLIMDLVMILSKRKPMFTKIYKKIHKFQDLVTLFAYQQWTFHNNNTQALWSYLSDADQKMFPFSMKQLDWKEYHMTQTMGLRVYLFGDDLSTLPVAKKRWRRFCIAHQSFKFLLYVFWIYLGYSLIKLFY